MLADPVGISGMLVIALAAEMVGEGETWPVAAQLIISELLIP